MFLWWYSSGWKVFVGKLKTALSNTTDFFSMGSLVRTLFKPYRQISAAAASDQASLDIKFHMFLDRLVSRIVGFFSRLTLLLVGIIIIIFGGVLSLILILLWPFIPLLPVAGIILTVIGVTLWASLLIPKIPVSTKLSRRKLSIAPPSSLFAILSVLPCSLAVSPF